MSTAKSGDTVTVHYTGKLEDGSVFDSSKDGEPLEFTIGSGQVIAGFEHAVIGMSPGDSRTEKILARDGYGDYSEASVAEVGRDKFPSEMQLHVGQSLRVKDPQQRTMQVVIAQLSEDKVTLDANHPLAGKDLLFEIELLQIG